MEATTLGINRTGAAASPEGAEAMAQAVAVLSPPVDIDMSGSEAFHIATSRKRAPWVPSRRRHRSKAWSSRALPGSWAQPGIFMDKIGERIAFERGGTRLYEALITKYNALRRRRRSPVPAEEALTSQGDETRR
jgi:hypothetical protein